MSIIFNMNDVKSVYWPCKICAIIHVWDVTWQVLCHRFNYFLIYFIIFLIRIEISKWLKELIEREVSFWWILTWKWCSLTWIVVESCSAAESSSRYETLIKSPLVCTWVTTFWHHQTISQNSVVKWENTRDSWRKMQIRTRGPRQTFGYKEERIILPIYTYNGTWIFSIVIVE